MKDVQKGYVVALTVSVIAIIVAGLAYTSALQPAIQPQPREEKVISVTGIGTIATVPDEVRIQLAVETRSRSSEEAQRMNAEKMRRVIDTLKAMGIPEKSMETSGFSLIPITKQDDFPRRPEESINITGYICRNNLQVKLTDVTRAGSTIDAAVSSGANIVSGIYFTVSETRAESLRSEALQKAVADAKAKAQLAADAGGVRIIGLKNLNIGGVYIPMQFKEVRAGAAGTPILPGETEITVTVQANYIFE